jgi:prepilin-type processing-associated H-X9-DG protein
VFVCPSAERDQKAWERTKKISAATVSYRWVAGLKAVSRPDFIMMYDKSVEHHKDGRNVLCVDGHVEWMKEEEFQKRLAEQRDKMREMRAGRR